MQRRTKTPLEAPQARDAALRLLGRREHSARELQSKLRARGVEAESAGEIVDGLKESGWQSDERYAEMLVQSRVGQGHGPLRIEAEMRVAGISAEAIRAAMDAAGTDWDELIQRVWKRHFRTPARDAQERQKQYRYLMGRGFDSATISRLLKHEEDE
ncbi:MAG: regulatory protein RecX [Hydrocarboniphaga sp.]|uniref:regulatory protein RecX n=1 Tax=Hydrocarboniphaga sp. TaxID=2033016 RepID=UPI00260D29AD|nr:regulatory protein RecX [Hydrocarboniphaga sp.]MDB5971541.1 regulatory protein RecX [Hydrocarboniphaga sp.]